LTFLAQVFVNAEATDNFERKLLPGASDAQSQAHIVAGQLVIGDFAGDVVVVENFTRAAPRKFAVTLRAGPATHPNHCVEKRLVQPLQKNFMAYLFIRTGK
jgi:hypothetical protein